ncbi:Dynein regulatory complex subunit 7 [Pleodorina starrii]|uniref:Dynein regulatory complex subunit 7 n=1 Tax=Pleodorina starrii TaxID=330485 RepID=A0A9W6BL55_9CHLO|nr:Dynein regulatory complex subunit 7 [Pleodorina starrii]GLC54124.1 Dynein regulatory complex subunit 7 [Pleodorina starrii]GLC64572.1 Dynein regulatory complex subunit 7 [Pleodorina starrii]
MASVAAPAEVGTLSREVLEERLMEARRTYRLNMGYAGLKQLPPGFVDLVKKYNPHITELELSSNDLTDLPDELEEFRYLRILRLKYNQLKRIPGVVYRLQQLMVFDVSGNKISKVDESVGHLTLLKELDVSGNEITTLPDSLASLPKLEVVQVENNRLELLPDNLGELAAVIKMDLSTNNLRYLPNSMGQLKKVQRIDVGNNLLTKVPPSMGHLKTLKEFNLRYNNLDERYKAKVEEGLSKFLAFLREEEERERLEEIERLKPIGTPVGSYLEYRCKAEVGQLVKTEMGDITVDNRCWIRTGHTLTQVGSMLLIFGGQLQKDGSTTNDLFWMTMDRMEWHNQPCKGEKPPPRYNHAACYDEENNRLIVFGGRTAERKRLNDVAFLDLDTWTWYKPSTEGAAPSPREQAVSTFWAGNMVLFGGHAIGGRTNDLFLLDLGAWQWSQPAFSGTAPSPRQACALCIGHGNLLFVHGGRNNFVLEDLHVMDFVTKTWTEIPCEGRCPPPRHSHHIHVHRDHLYLFGGLDELGAQSNAMFRVHLPGDQQETYATAKPKWVEWDSELPYNKNRTATLWNGTISIYQLGSNTLGRVNDDDAEKGLVFWDVFKTAKLEGLKPRQLAEDELRPKNAKRMRVQHTINTAGKMPRTFTQHTAHEARVLQYVQDFQRIFEELYPYRRPLYLSPRNECGVPKFVCTSLRPSQLVYTELYDLDGAAQFVADFLSYEPLEDPLHPPDTLPSPMSVLDWRAGDSFDLAVVLASLLIGVGFNAFVVMGYAPYAVVQNDQRNTVCTVLEREAQGAAAAAGGAGGKGGADAAGGRGGSGRGGDRRTRESSTTNPPIPAGALAGAVPEQRAPRYVIKPLASLKSKVLQAKAEDPRAAATPDRAAITSPEAGAAGADEEGAGIGDPMAAAAADSAAAGGTADGAGGGGDADDPDAGICKFVHAWVMVLPGKRDVSEAMFIEPSTGRKYPLTDSPYKGIEMLWNHRNFWVCLQQPQPHSDSRAEPKDISYDLSDPSKWEPVFEERGMRSRIEGATDESEVARAEGGNSRVHRNDSVRTPVPGPMALGGKSNKSSTSSARLQGVGGMSVAQRMAQRNKLTTPGGGGGGGGGGGAMDTPPRTADSHAGGGGGDGGLGDDGDGVEADVVPDMPPSWVLKLSIPRDAFDMRCPRGSKTTLYRRCQHEIFARFGDCSRWDGMVERLVLYADDERTVVAEIRETFTRRRDKLRERRVYPQKDTTIELFDRGSAFALKDILTVKNSRRVFNFYAAARLDGLEKREELENLKIMEHFVGRDDRLVYRSATYTEEAAASAGGAGAEAASETDPEEDALRRTRKSRGARGGDKRMLPIRKMTEKFGRNAGLDADADVAKRVYYLTEGRMRVDYHFGANRITNSSRSFTKDGQSQIVQVDPLAPRPQPAALLEEYSALLVAEKDCLQSVRDSEWEISEITRTRTNQEQNITLETPYYDIVRIKAEESEEEEEEAAEAAYDYLSPFLPTLLGTQQLTRTQALEVREKALKALKDRLIERANIIQARLDEETAALAKRQQTFHRDRDQMTASEEEEYERQTEESMFRIHILERRLRRHEEQALHKYYELDAKLRGDGRLQALLNVF